jgi:hypothetical protein
MEIRLVGQLSRQRTTTTAVHRFHRVHRPMRPLMVPPVSRTAWVRRQLRRQRAPRQAHRQHHRRERSGAAQHAQHAVPPGPPLGMPCPRTTSRCHRSAVARTSLQAARTPRRVSRSATTQTSRRRCPQTERPPLTPPWQADSCPRHKGILCLQVDCVLRRVVCHAASRLCCFLPCANCRSAQWNWN